MLSSVLQLLFNAADVVIVGRFAGDTSLAAVGSTTQLINLLVNMFVGLSVGVNVLTARYYGAKMEKELSGTVHTAMAISIVGGICLMLIGIVSAPYILVWMQTPAEVMELAIIYLRIYFVGMPAMFVYNFGAAILRAVGDTKRPLYYLVTAGVINVTFNLFFVIVLKWDVFGVGLATTISQFVSATFMIRCLMKEEGAIRVELKKIRFNKDKLIRILKIGLPAGLQGTLFSISNVMVQSSINSFGTITICGQDRYFWDVIRPAVKSLQQG